MYHHHSYDDCFLLFTCTNTIETSFHYHFGFGTDITWKQSLLCVCMPFRYPCSRGSMSHTISWTQRRRHLERYCFHVTSLPKCWRNEVHLIFVTLLLTLFFQFPDTCCLLLCIYFSIVLFISLICCRSSSLWNSFRLRRWACCTLYLRGSHGKQI